MRLRWPTHIVLAFLATAVLALGAAVLVQALLFRIYGDPGRLSYATLCVLAFFLFVGARKTARARRARRRRSFA